MPDPPPRIDEPAPPRRVERKPALPRIPCGRGKGPRFDVHGVASEDVLNVRVSPSATSEVIGKLPPKTVNVLGLGEQKLVGPTEWRRIRCNDVAGWVNSTFLMERDD